MLALLLIIGLVLLLFGMVLLFGAPYLPTLKPQIESIFKELSASKGERLIELGCGDGRVLIMAAKNGLNATGYELNPILYLVALIRCRKYSPHITVIWGNFWRKQWPETDYIFTFLLPKFMTRLDQMIIDSSKKPVILISFAFEIKGKTAYRVSNGVYFYRYKKA